MDSSPIFVGSKLDDFKIIEQLGKGSCGTVYKITSLINNKDYCLKKINLKPMRQSRRNEALKEAKLLKQMRHKNIIQYYNSFVENEHLCIIMEYAEGGDLNKLIKSYVNNNQNFTESEFWSIAQQLCLSIQYLHDHNIIHRDIKSLNVFLKKDRTIKLGDLGFSKIMQKPQQQIVNSNRVGTPLYLAPELVQQGPYDQKVDIWALGYMKYLS